MYICSASELESKSCAYTGENPKEQRIGFVRAAFAILNI